jgi:hypothetical protein
LRALLGAVAALACVPVAAGAATVSIDANIETRITFTLRYAAAPGESNDVTAVRTGGGVRVTDSGAPLTAGSECQQLSAHEALCRLPSHDTSWELGDGDDRIAVPDLVGNVVSCGAGFDVVENSPTGEDALIRRDCELWQLFPGAYVRVRPSYSRGKLGVRFECPDVAGGCAGTVVAHGFTRGRLRVGAGEVGAARMRGARPRGGLLLRFSVTAGGRRYTGAYTTTP